MASFSKDVRERLALWDAKESCLSPLTDQEKDSVLLLTAYSSNRSIPSEVRVFIHDLIRFLCSFDVANNCTRYTKRSYDVIIRCLL